MKKKPPPKREAKAARPSSTSNENAPFCKICETRHWGREPHVFTKAAKAKRS